MPTKNSNKVAIIIGATGLVGQHLLQRLVTDERYTCIKTFTRVATNSPNNNVKVENHVVEFDDIESWRHLLIADELYICIGTTLKKAKTKHNQTKIDLTYPSLIGDAAKANGITTAVVVSSVGANKDASSFYLRLKGQLEQHYLNLNFEKLIIVRPSVLVGNRPEFRFGEWLGTVFLTLCKPIPVLGKYRPIPAKQVAHTMVKLANQSSKAIEIRQLLELF